MLQVQVSTIDSSAVSVAFQAIGALLLSLIMAQLARIFTWRYVPRWAMAWSALATALLAVRIYIGTGSAVPWFFYLILEWTFLFLVWTGCRELATRASLKAMYGIRALPVAILAGMAITHFSPTFNDMFVIEAGIVAAAMMASFITLGRTPPERRTAGWETIRLSLAVLTLLYIGHVPLYLFNAHIGKLRFLSHSSLTDLVADLFLGFGMILVAAEDANRELQEALALLELARSNTEQKLHVDPLTEALNRHAFHWMQRGDEIATEGVLSGVVLMIDIDRLKRINDEFGHATGDIVIRAAANSIRGLIRGDDLLFRWGGDEFVAILPNLSAAVVAERMVPLETGIAARTGNAREVLFTISWGSCEFGPQRSIEEAMRLADEEMYGRRRIARTASRR
jgi:diguanylate cyclase (GGDEF)-like protein